MHAQELCCPARDIAINSSFPFCQRSAVLVLALSLVAAWGSMHAGRTGNPSP